MATIWEFRLYSTHIYIYILPDCQLSLSPTFTHLFGTQKGMAPSRTLSLRWQKNGAQYVFPIANSASIVYMGVSKNHGTPKIIHFNRVFHYKLSILGYPYFWKHPYRFSQLQQTQRQSQHQLFLPIHRSPPARVLHQVRQKSTDHSRKCGSDHEVRSSLTEDFRILMKTSQNPKKQTKLTVYI